MMDVRGKLIDLFYDNNVWCDQKIEGLADDVMYIIDNGVTVQERGNWKYYHKQNKAVCTNCSFERDLDANFGKAIACPNCGARMDLEALQ
jgi:hypothetical protein